MTYRGIWDKNKLIRMHNPTNDGLTCALCYFRSRATETFFLKQNLKNCFILDPLLDYQAAADDIFTPWCYVSEQVNLFKHKETE